jgi:hypothetical protein
MNSTTRCKRTGRLLYLRSKNRRQNPTESSAVWKRLIDYQSGISELSACVPSRLWWSAASKESNLFAHSCAAIRDPTCTVSDNNELLSTQIAQTDEALGKLDSGPKPIRADCSLARKVCNCGQTRFPQKNTFQLYSNFFTPRPATPSDLTVENVAGLFF